MNKYRILFSLILLLVAGKISGQNFRKSYGGIGSDIGYDVAALPNGSIIGVGETNSYGAGHQDMYIIKTNSKGDLLWNKIFGGSGDDGARAVEIGPQGEIYVMGYTTSGPYGGVDLDLRKFLQDGTLLWDKVIGSSGNDWGTKMVYRAGKLFIVGKTNGYGAQGDDVWFLRTDTMGNVEVNRTIGWAGTDYASCMMKCYDGSFLISGISTSILPYNTFVFDVNQNGDTLWTNRFITNYNGSNYNLSVSVGGLTQLPDSSYVIVGYGQDGSMYGESWTARLLPSGWTNKFIWMSSLAEDFLDVVGFPDGSYISCSSNCNFGCTYRLSKYTQNDQLIWRKIYDYGSGANYNTFAHANRLVKTGAKMLLTGYTNMINLTADFLIARIDSSGNIDGTPGLTITANGPTNLCWGDSLLITATPGYNKYIWHDDYTNKIIGDGLTLNLKTKAYVYCVASDSAGYTISNVLNVTFYPRPDSSVTGNFSACKQAGVQPFLKAASGFAYQWYKDTSIIAGATGQQYSPSSSGNYKVLVRNACGSKWSSLHYVDTAAAPTAIISCAGTGCLGSSRSCYISGTGNLCVPDMGAFSTYSWFRDGNPLGVNNDTINLNTSGLPGVYTCTVTNLCGTTSSPGFHLADRYSKINIYVVGGTVITGNCNVAPQTTLAYNYLAADAIQPVLWYKDSIPIPGSINSTLTVSASGNYYVKYTTPNCIDQSYSNVKTLILKTPPIPTITAPNGRVKCSGKVNLVIAPSDTSLYYNWYKDGVRDSIIHTFSYDATVTGVYTCSVFLPECGDTLRMGPMVVSIGSPKGIVTTPDAAYCQGYSSALTCVPLVNDSLYHYRWKKHGVFITGDTARFLNATTPGQYACFISNGCGSSTTASINVTQKTLPVYAISGTSGHYLCAGINDTLAVVNSPALNYKWYYIYNGTVHPINDITNKFVVTFASSFYVDVSAANCPTIQSQIFSVETLPSPSSTLHQPSLPQFCSGDTIELYTNNLIATQWQWYKNGIPLTGKTDTLLAVSDSGSYYFEARNQCARVQSAVQNIDKKSSPGAVVSLSGPVVFCLGDSVILSTNNNSSYSYKWYRDYHWLPNFTSNHFTANQQGDYFFCVTNKYACSNNSAIVSVSVPCRLGEPELDTIQKASNYIVYPNPSVDGFHLLLNTNSASDHILLQMFDLAGRVVKPSITKISVNEYFLNQLESGSYFLQISDNGLSEMKKIIVQ